MFLGIMRIEAETAKSAPATPASPRAIDSVFICPKPETTFSNIKSAAASSIIARPLETLKLPNFAANINAESSANKTPTPISPFVSCLTSSCASCFTAFVKI